MDGFETQALARLPLATGVLQLLHFVTDEATLTRLYDAHRGRNYERVLTFALMVQLMADAILQHGGSGHQCFQRSREAGRLPCSEQAVYDKLKRMPPAVSQALLAGCTDRLREVSTRAGETDGRPPSLQEFDVEIIDGKKLKHVAKRLKVTRGYSGTVLGGKIVAALSLADGLATAFSADVDGERNDGPLVPALLPQVYARAQAAVLWIADSQFCDLTQPALLTAGGNHFLLRYHPKTRFFPDENGGTHGGTDDEGRPYVESWGWLGGESDPRRVYVRRIAVPLTKDEDLILVTDLLDADRYPAVELLQAYGTRWDIDELYRRVTDVFDLKRLIGHSPEATIFQCAFCLLLANVIHVVRQIVARTQDMKAKNVSTYNLFYDTRRELTAWATLVHPMPVLQATPRCGAEELLQQLSVLLAAAWTPRWIKAPTRRQPRRPKDAAPGGHTSVHRLRQHPMGMAKGP